MQDGGGSVTTDYSIIVHVRGHTYLPVSGIAETYHQSKSTVERNLKGILDTDRYRGYRPVINEDGDKLVNLLVYEDYLACKGKMKEKNLARHLPPFDPAEVRKNWGEYKVPVIIGG